jgi:hypothetical protein
MMLYQDKGGNFTEMADYSNILQENYISEGICDQEVLLQGKSVRESLPTYGFIRTTFYLYEFLSGTTTFMATESSLPTVIQRTKTIQIPQRNPYSRLANFVFRSYHSPMVSTHSHFKITQIFLI